MLFGETIGIEILDGSGKSMLRATEHAVRQAEAKKLRWLGKKSLSRPV
jgi:hypothetical protein